MLPRNELWTGLSLGCIVVGKGIEIQRCCKGLKLWLWLGLSSVFATRTESSGVLGSEGSVLQPHSLIEFGMLVIGLVQEDAGVRKDLVAVINSKPRSEGGSDEFTIIE